MPAVVRFRDVCSGHADFPPRDNIEASSNVFANSLGVHRQGDYWNVHCNPVPVCHSGFTTSGSSSVFVNSKPIARIGDDISCGSTCAQGSPNVFAGG